MKIADITAFLETIAPLHLQENYDNAGLITGHPDWEVSGVIVSLDAIEAVIDEAVEKGCNLVIAHHPIVFKGLKRINGLHYVERTIIKAIKHDIAIYAIHTNLDNVHQNGVNQKIAEKIGIGQTRVLKPKMVDKPEIGSGLIGKLPKPMSCMQLLEHVKSVMKCGTIRHTKLLKENVQVVALCGGSGSFLIRDAIKEGAEVYITADVKYHDFFEANDEIMIFDIGHYESEQYTTELLVELLNTKFSTFAAHFTNLNTNPINYF